MDGREPMSEQSIRVRLPYEAVVKHVLALGDVWLRDAARSAIPPEVVAPSSGTMPFGEALIGEPLHDNGMCALPLSWFGAGRPPWKVSGLLALRPAEGPAETYVAMRTWITEWFPESAGPAPLPGDEVADFVARSFLQRLYWALEALDGTGDRRPAEPAPTGGLLPEPAPEDYDW